MNYILDNLTAKQRRKNMQHIKNKDTLIELKLRKKLWNKGYRYRKNVNKLPGKPDIVLSKYKIAIFCDSEFFHGKDWDALKSRLEKSNNSEYFYLWKCFDKDGVEAYLKGLLKTEVNKLKFICAMATKWHSTNGSGWRFYPQNYSEYISQNEVYNMIQGFDKSKLNQFTDIEQIKLASFALNYNKNEMDHADEQAALNLISEWKTGKAE